MQQTLNRIAKYGSLLVFFLLVSAPIIAQESGTESSENLKDDVVESDSSKNSSNNKGNIQPLPHPCGFYLGSKFAINKIDDEGSRHPFETSFSLGFEYEWKFARYFALTPSLDLSFFHYLWTSDIATHAESENRTAFTIAFTMELPFMFVFDLKRWNISFGASLAILARGSALDLGIKKDDVSPTGLTAKEEVKKINAYHWQNGRFFYPAIKLKGEYIFDNGWKIGILFSNYIPIFNAWSKQIVDTQSGKMPFMHDAIFGLAVIIHPAKSLKSSR